MDSHEQNNIGVALKIMNIIIAAILVGIMFMIPNGKDQELAVFNQNMGSMFNINIEGHIIPLTDNTAGYLSTLKNKRSVLEEVCNNYIKELGLEPKNIVQIDIYGKTDSINEKERLLDLNESGEVASEVYNATVINEELLDLQVKINVAEEEKIQPEIVSVKTDELYMGQSVTVQGEEGKNIVYKELTFDGLDKSEEIVLREDMIKPVVNTVVKTGTKNPYSDGIAFLYNPSVGGYISSNFGEVRSKSIHKGIDIAKNQGESVNASLEGKVISAGYNSGGYGNLIIIEHENNMKTYYAHLSEIYVNTGDYVTKGSVIGAIGSTGNSTGPHLHFELRVNDTPVDPINYIENK